MHRQENPGPRAKEEETIAKAIGPIFAEHKERYGSLRIHQELWGQGISVSRKRVARLMKKSGLHAKSRRRFKRTKPTGIQAIAADHLDRQFCPIRPDLAWAGDITTIDKLIGGATWLSG